MQQKKILDIENFGVSFYSKIKNKNYFVLRDINLEVYSKQKIAIVGESGSGKTTLANSILLLNDRNITTYFGNIKFYPVKNSCNCSNNVVEIINSEKTLHALSYKEISHIRGFHISIIFQDPFNALNPVIKIGKQIEEVIENHNPFLKRDEIYEKTLELLKKVKLEPNYLIYNKYPHQLSGGQLQRICIATSIANSPEIIIADEPTTALDSSLKEEILNLLLELVENEQSSLIIITHDINIIKDYVDYIYILYAGEIIEYGTTKQIFYNPLHPYTQLLFECYPKKDKKGQKLKIIPLGLPDFSEVDFIFKKCIFLNRCPQKFNICFEKKPKFYAVKEQKVKCFLYEKSHRS